MRNVVPSSPESSRRLGRVRQRDTSAEIELRSALSALGLRYRLQVQLLSKPRRVADIVFRGPRVAVFVDGCFWHGCPLHASWPKTNAAFWRAKIETNRARDADTDRRLRAIGWEVVRVWAHESAAAAARRIHEIIETRASRRSDGKAPPLPHRQIQGP